MPEPSLLPEEIRKAEEERKKAAPPERSIPMANLSANGRLPASQPIRPAPPPPPPPPVPPRTPPTPPRPPETMPTNPTTPMKNKETSGGKKLPPVSFSLLPSEDRPSAAKKPGKGWPVWGSALAAVVLVGLARGGLEVAASGRRVDVNRLDEKIATATTALETARRGAKDAEALGRRIASVKKLLGEHRHFTAFLAALEQATIPEVSYLNLDADTEKSVQLQAVATDFAAAARQIRAAELSPAVAAASVESVSAVFDDRGNIEGVKFTLTLTPKL